MKHRTPWQTFGEVGIAFDGDVRELNDGSSDWTQARDLSREHPDKLHELQRLFLIEATRYNVLPLDDRSFERVLPEISGKPELVAGTKQLLLPGNLQSIFVNPIMISVYIGLLMWVTQNVVPQIQTDDGSHAFFRIDET